MTLRFPADFRPFAEDDAPDFISRADALALLGVKAPTLYTYVSRGLVRSVPRFGSKARGFSRADVQRLASRGRAHRSQDARAVTAMRWGEPIINTRITELTPQGPRYRGLPVRSLVDSGATFEAVAELLWTGELPVAQPWPSCVTIDPDRIVEALALSSPVADPLTLAPILLLAQGLEKQNLEGSVRKRLDTAGRQIVQILAGMCGYLCEPFRFVPPRPGEGVAGTVLRALGAEPNVETARVVETALILCADFDLAPSTFTARIASSAGADVYASTAAGLSAHAGVLTGLSCNRAEDLLFAGAPIEARIEMLRTVGRRACGFNHPFYREGDPRAAALIELARTCDPAASRIGQALQVLDAAKRRFGVFPGLQIGLVMLAIALGLPRNAAVMLWTIGRSAGQIAHALEQRGEASVLRPRARYTGR